jgi:hypothetical protein
LKIERKHRPLPGFGADSLNLNNPGYAEAGKFCPIPFRAKTGLLHRLHTG